MAAGTTLTAALDKLIGDYRFEHLAAVLRQKSTHVVLEATPSKEWTFAIDEAFEVHKQFALIRRLPDEENTVTPRT